LSRKLVIGLDFGTKSGRALLVDVILAAVYAGCLRGLKKTGAP
jgi:ribulose kinase